MYPHSSMDDCSDCFEPDVAPTDTTVNTTIDPDSASQTVDWLYLGGLVLLGSFAWIPDSYFKMVGWPCSLVWQVGFVIIAAGCCYRLRLFQDPFRRLGHGLDWAVLALVASLVISSLMAQFPLLALQNTLVVVFYLITLYSLRNSTLPWLREISLAQGLVVMGAVASIISLTLWQPDPSMWLSDDFGAALRNRFPLGHHNFSGGFYVLMTPVAVGLTLGQSGWRRWFNGGASLTLAVSIYASGSRGAWLGALAMVFVALGVMLLRSRGKRRWQACLLSIVVLIVIGGLLLSNPRIRNLAKIQPTTSSSAPLTTLAITHLSDTPTKDRFFMAQASWNIFKDHPLLGLGPGNLGRVYDLYRPIETGIGLDQVQQLHNLPLQILSEIGLVGLMAYGWGLVCLIRCWRQLNRGVLRIAAASSQHSRSFLPQPCLVDSIGLSFLGYSISSLTDYQLENIPISLTLVGWVVILLQLSDPLPQPLAAISSSKASPAKAPWANSTFTRALALPLKYRRWASLFLLVALGLVLQFWVRNSLAFALTDQGLKAIQSDTLTQADLLFYRAAKVTPWDPTPSALAAEQLVELAQDIENSTDQDLLLTEAISLYQQALQAAPNDIWLNNNLAVLALQQDPDLALLQARKTVQLSPRNPNYSYYLLGLTYLDQQQPDLAVEAFALESLVNPNFAFLSLWDTPDFQGLRAKFLALTLQHYDSLLAEISQQSRFYPSLYKQKLILSWWASNSPSFQDIALSESTETALPLHLQALVIAESNPTQALELLNQCIIQDASQTNLCQLLRAWLQPDLYLTDYLATANLSDGDTQQLITHIQTHRTLKAWLKSTQSLLPQRQRYGLTLIYRNLYANHLTSILRPTPLQTYALIDLLQLTIAMPREFPVLDHLLESLRVERLNLPHSTQNHFQLTP